MKVIKPNYVTPLPAVFDDGRRLHCVVTAVFHTTFDGELCEERLLWPFANEDVEGSVLDEAKPKTQAEFLVHGNCFARGPDVRQSFVRARVGDKEKKLAVFGKRTFSKLGVPSDPEPFQSVPIRWTHAFGGPDYQENPNGKGHKTNELPQLEVPGKLMASPGDKPPIASFGRVDVTLPQRMKKLGTYDTKWQKTRYPGMAEDFDPSYFQLTQPDQWQKEFYKGDEAFWVENMHPDKEKVEGKLPGITARFFVLRNGELIDVPMRIDTVHLFPSRERQVIVCRGVTPTSSDTLDDIEEVGLGLEWIGRPKPRSHYEEVFATRRRKDGGGLASLDDSPLLPEMPAKKKERIVPPGEGLRQRQLERQIDHQYEVTKREMLAAGIDPKHLPAPPPKIDVSVDPDDIPPMPPPPTKEEVYAQIAAKRTEMLEGMKAQVESETAGVPEETAQKLRQRMEEISSKVENDVVGPPALTREKFRRDLEEQVVTLRDAGVDPSGVQAQLDDEEIDQQIRDLESTVRETYRTMVQHQGTPPVLGPEENVIARGKAQARVDAQEPFVGLDLTGADLSGMDLGKANLRESWLEASNLSGAQLAGADLEGAVLARAKLVGVDLRECKLRGANFSHADLTGADLSGQDLTGCFFMGTNFTDTKLEGAILNEVDLTDASFVRADLSGVTAKNGLHMGMRFDGASLRDVTWHKVVLYQCALVDVDARRAKLDLVLTVDTTFERVRFDDAKLSKLQVVKIDKPSELTKCTFLGATLEQCLFREVLLRDCDFSHSNFPETDFSKSTADGTNFEDARGVGARFMGASVRDCKFARADLMDTLFGGAFLDRASFEDANLFRADLGRSTGANVNMKGANVKRVRTVPKREEQP